MLLLYKDALYSSRMFFKTSEGLDNYLIIAILSTFICGRYKLCSFNLPIVICIKKADQKECKCKNDTCNGFTENCSDEIQWPYIKLLKCQPLFPQ